MRARSTGELKWLESNLRAQKDVHVSMDAELRRSSPIGSADVSRLGSLTIRLLGQTALISVVSVVIAAKTATQANIGSKKKPSPVALVATGSFFIRYPSSL